MFGNDIVRKFIIFIGDRFAYAYIGGVPLLMLAYRGEGGGWGVKMPKKAAYVICECDIYTSGYSTAQQKLVILVTSI